MNRKYKRQSPSKAISKAMSFTQFMQRFSTEQDCAAYLFAVKWPNGFVCPVCGHRHGYALNRPGRYQCAKCRRQTSLTAGTMMHHSHVPLKKWFLAMYLTVCDKRGISALALAGKIGVSYDTAWNLLRRIRMAMENRDANYMLDGFIEFDDSYFGAKIKGKEGRGAGNQGVFIAVAKDEAGRPQYLKMRLTPNVQKPSVQGFVDENLVIGSTVETDGFRSYREPLAEEYTHHVENFSPDSDHLKWLHRIIGNAKAFINGTYHGTSTKHLQMYLSEFCYRFNRRRFHGDIFDRLLAAVVDEHYILGQAA